MKKHDDNDEKTGSMFLMFGITFIIATIYLLIKTYVEPLLFK